MHDVRHRIRESWHAAELPAELLLVRVGQCSQRGHSEVGGERRAQIREDVQPGNVAQLTLQESEVAPVARRQPVRDASARPHYERVQPERKEHSKGVR